MKSLQLIVVLIDFSLADDNVALSLANPIVGHYYQDAHKWQHTKEHSNNEDDGDLDDATGFEDAFHEEL